MTTTNVFCISWSASCATNYVAIPWSEKFINPKFLASCIPNFYKPTTIQYIMPLFGNHNTPLGVVGPPHRSREHGGFFNLKNIAAGRSECCSPLLTVSHPYLSAGFVLSNPNTAHGGTRKHAEQGLNAMVSNHAFFFHVWFLIKPLGSIIPCSSHGENKAFTRNSIHLLMAETSTPHGESFTSSWPSVCFTIDVLLYTILEHSTWSVIDKLKCEDRNSECPTSRG